MSMTKVWKGGLVCAVYAFGLPAVGLVTVATPAQAQDRDSIPGVSLGLVYENQLQPTLAMQPFTGRFGGAGLAAEVEAIMGRDLRNSDRFEVMDSLPAGLVGDVLDYRLWDRLGAVMLVTGQVEGTGDGFILILELHDVVYGQVTERGRFRLPDAADPDYRMAVHRASDDIVRWATGAPGMAATRIAFTMTDEDYNSEVYVIDSDGENLTRLTNFRSITNSPAWSPDGSKLAYSSFKTGLPRIYQLDLATGAEWTLPDVRGEGDYMAPSYSPDGQTLAFSILGNARSGVFTYNIARECCLTSLSGGQHYDLSPTYSPDGLKMAFNTNRFGDNVPQIMVMPAGGGDAETLSPYEYGGRGYYTSPDWSPVGDLVAFHGAVRRGTHHILVADMANDGRRLLQLTWEGNNEDPSWAPDGRHIVFVGERRWGFGLFVVDVASGRLRPIVSGRKVGLPDWSPPIGASN
jgi:TolB protein